MQDRLFYSSCFGFTLGVLLRSFLNLDFYFAVFLGFLSLVLFLFAYFSQLKWWSVTLIFTFAISLGILRFNVAEKPLPSYVESRAGEKMIIQGIIVDEPDVRVDNQKLTVETKDSKFLVTANFYDEYKYGDEVTVEGIVAKPENFTTDTGKEFDYINYLKKDGIFYLINYPVIEVISQGHGFFLKRYLFALKGKFLEKINQNISEPESLLLGGLILGEKAAFSQEIRQKFIDTGTIHIVALSGYNVTIVAEWIMKIFAFLPRNMGFGAGILGILFFVLMSGGSSTAVRAGIMAILVLIARLTGRTYDVGRALIIAGVLMILINPYVLVYDVSFQLSFIATVAVIFFAPRIEKYFYWVPERFGLRDVVTVTSAAYIFVLPFVLYKMGTLSLVALPANILILPLIPITMAFGFFTSLLGMIWYILAMPFAFVSMLLLKWELGVINFFSSIPFASLSIPNFPLTLTLIIYGYLIYRLFWRSIKEIFIERF